MPRKRKPPQQGPGYSDSQAPKVPTGLPYGEGAKLERSQQAMPLPQQTTPSTAGYQQQAPGPVDYAAAEVPPPPITSPTDRPNEPLTTGMATGPGAGPEVLGQMPGLSAGDRMRALYAAYPTPELGQLIAYMDEQA